LHAPQIQGFFDIACDNIAARPLFEWYVRNVLFKNEFDQGYADKLLVVASADKGGIENASDMADNLGLDFAFIYKRRKKHVLEGGNPVAEHLLGNVEGKIVIILDDIISSVGTLEAAVKLCMKKGAKDTYAFSTHGLFHGSYEDKTWVTAEERIKRSNLKIFVTDTISRTQEDINRLGITELSVAPIVAESLYRMEIGDSVSKIASPTNKILSPRFEMTMKDPLFYRVPQVSSPPN
jgi:ribose-phosphate pyrophosphokinase